MVSSLSIVFMFVSFLLSVGFPLGLMIYFYRKWKISLFAVFTGALMFFLFQMVLRIPALTLIQMQSWYEAFARQYTVLTGVIIAFTAGLFETVGRYLGMRYMIKDRLSRENGIAYGIGHGGIEAVLLVGITYAANILYSLLINAGLVDGTLVPQLVELSPDIFLAAGIERVFAILFHIAAALLVAYGIMHRNFIYVLLSLLFHTLLDAVAVILQIYRLPIWGIEVWAAVVGLASLVFIIKSKGMFAPAEAVEAATEAAIETGGNTVDTGGDTVDTSGDIVETDGNTVDTSGDTVETGGDKSGGENDSEKV